MRRKLLTLFSLLLLSVATAYAASGISISYFLTVHLKDGSQHDILLDNRPTLSFDKSCLTVSTTSVEFKISDVAKFTFYDKTNSTPSNIEEVKVSEKPSVRISDTEVTFLNVGQGTGVNVYNVSGQKVFMANRAVDNNVTIDWSSFPPGIYIFRINKYSFKIMKK
jgi:hypothetical protein